MKVTLNIENDEQLRSHIKDAIKGQVLSIVREEFLEIVRDELQQKLKTASGYKFEKMLKDAMRSSVGGILRQDHNVSTWSKDFIKPYIESIIADSVKGIDWDKAVNAAATRKLKSLIE